MFPLTSAIPAAVPLPFDMPVGVGPLAAMFVLLGIGAAALLRFALALRRRDRAAAVRPASGHPCALSSGRPGDHPLAA